VPSAPNEDQVRQAATGCRKVDERRVSVPSLAGGNARPEYCRVDDVVVQSGGTAGSEGLARLDPACDRTVPAPHPPTLWRRLPDRSSGRLTAGIPIARSRPSTMEQSICSRSPTAVEGRLSGRVSVMVDIGKSFLGFPGFLGAGWIRSQVLTAGRPRLLTHCRGWAKRSHRAVRTLPPRTCPQWNVGRIPRLPQVARLAVGRVSLPSWPPPPWDRLIRRECRAFAPRP